ncbi:IclR family transcriptional regulator [Microbacterium barkeri]|uniref:IclR family transcriptional regulator n=1 Tax=Microbacterium barkeri TaxID=33917 RepID=A0A9W6H3L1_9MICO|nr:IclR family transcriptional regulator [Microbacterium barkeri]MDR6878101.1 DNA-binding IclR family transcriptional regulator [Microbacterium barkeri]GLJ61514.1 IclR family transcriptional regulator [Microbacterium barkeri]
MSESSRVPAFENGLRILDLLARASGPLQAATIAQRLELPRSTVYHLLNVAERAGYVMRLPDESRYGLGIAAVDLGSSYARTDPLARLGRVHVARLVDRIGLSAHLAVLHGREVLYIVEIRAKHAPDLVTAVDVRLPAQLTASGRAILAALPKAQLRALYPDARAFVQRHAEKPAVTTYAELRRVLEEGRLRGWAEETGDVTPGLSSVAVPVLDHRGWPVAAIAITYPDASVAPERLPALVDDARSVAEEISRRIHGAPRDPAS